ncbi:MAG TPA: hypothetical protein VFQ61_00015, partial [Polyangiaceae bacterium]|nr:hypothetical protein [Polyangiaceae bacterium]
TQTALSVRKRFRQLFVQGEYSPLETFGHALAFARTFGSESIVVCVPRLPYRLTQGKPSWPMGKVWRAESVVLPVGRYRDAFTGRTLVSNGSVKLAVCFAAFPVALLISEPAAINEPADALEKSG